MRTGCSTSWAPGRSQARRDGASSSVSTPTTPTVPSRCSVETLSGGQRLTRAQCIAALQDAGVDASGQLGYHLLWYASQRGVTCIAPNIGNEQTFVLLDDWVPDPHRLGRDEALATITLRYFQSHGPASRKDFAGWTGLSMAEVKQGLALVADLIVRVDVDGAEMYVARQLLEGFSSGQTQGVS